MLEGRKYLVLREKSRSNHKPSFASLTNPLLASFRQGGMPRCRGDVYGKPCDPKMGNGQCQAFAQVPMDSPQAKKNPKKYEGKRVNTCKCKKTPGKTPKSGANARKTGKCGHMYFSN